MRDALFLALHAAAAGISVLTLDMRAHGDSGDTPFDKLPPAEQRKVGGWQNDVEAAFQFLVSQPEVNRGAIGLGGAARPAACRKGCGAPRCRRARVVVVAHRPQAC